MIKKQAETLRTKRQNNDDTAGSVRRKPSLRFQFTQAMSDANSDRTKFDPGFFAKNYRTLMEGEPPYADEAVLKSYLRQVRDEAVDPNTFFSESEYLKQNQDVATAIADGHFFCGFHHWVVSGQAEQREGWSKEAAPQPAQPKQAKNRVRITATRLLPSFDVSRGLQNLTVAEIRTILLETGLVDLPRYLAWYPDLASPGIDAVEHYITWGHRENRALHPFFDEHYYLRHNPDVATSGVLPIIHYLFIGATQGLNPHILLDTKAYSEKHSLDLGTTNPLIHYTLSKSKDGLIDAPYFDYHYYVERHPQCLEFPGGALLHFLYFGVYSGLKPSASFNPRYYYNEYLGNNLKINAYCHFLETGRAMGFKPQLEPTQSTVAREVARYANPGPDFEPLDTNLGKGRQKRAKLISFYLPQFHAFPENDEWWGTGFTEWRNIARALPRYAGHYQPRIPRDLGFYDLNDMSIMERQVQMALDMGIWGFAFYFYWFNRHRLMEKPLDAFVANKNLKMPYMILWANENWTRRWDGAENEVLIKQDHLPEDDAALVDCLQGYFADARYIRVQGRPLFVIYRADIIPNSKETLDKWRELFRERHGEYPLFFLAQTFKAEDPNLYGYDGAIEFPPHKVSSNLPEINPELETLDWDYEGSVRRYSDAVATALGEPVPDFPLMKTVFPSWDNNARRQNGGMVFDGATPDMFATWLDGAIDYSLRNPVMGENIVFINAWNEWCEGAYLEPDIYYGGAMLNRVAKTVSAPAAAFRGEKQKLLLIGHDAFQAGAQRNLLSIATTLQNRFGVDVHVVLLGDGEMLGRYQAAVPTTVSGPQTIDQTLSDLRARGFQQAIANTTVSGGLARLLKAHGFDVVTLVHELPNLIREYHLLDHVAAIREHSDHVVFASSFVKQAFQDNFGSVEHKALIRPQGVYNRFERDLSARARICGELGLDEGKPIVLNVAYGDIRKGVDLFLQTASLSSSRGLDTQFVWVGALHPQLKDWLLSDIGRAGLANLRFVGERTDVADFMNAADVFYLTSREDPFPSVLMEAMQVGLPVVAYAGNGGFVDLYEHDPKLGTLITQGDLDAALAEIARFAGRRPGADADAQHRIERARSEFDFADYVFDLLKLLNPKLEKVSVVVPNYNYERYIAARLDSIFDQTYPIYEIVVLDDCSPDRSLEEIHATISARGRTVTVHASEKNSGNVFAQWRRGLDEAKGKLLWIAEADDLAEPTLIERLVQGHVEQANCAFAFCDSQSMDSNGYRVYDSYIPYANSIKPGVLAESRVFTGVEFAKEALSVANLVLNVSSVLWNADALRASFKAVTDKGANLALAGDWAIYYSASRLGGTVAYVADPLNLHRRHAKSVTTEMDVEAHLGEIQKMHAFIRSWGGNRVELRRAQGKYVDQVRDWLTKRSA
jgi:glycosyltransferase involved in cell wall biosynthesis